MDDNKNSDERRAVLLEGMYNGVAGKIDEVCLSVQRELQYSSAQQADAYEALAGELRASVQSLLAELRYVAQQSSTIYDYNSRERDAMQERLLGEVKAQAEQVFEKLAAHMDEKLAAVAAPAEPKEIDYDLLAEKLVEKVVLPQPAEPKEIDYDLLVEKIAERLAPPAEEPAAEEVAEVAEEPVAEVEETAEATEVAEETASEEVAETAEPTEEAAETAEATEEAAEETADTVSETAEEPAEASAEAEQAAEQAEPVRRTVPFDDEAFDYDLLAEKIATAIPETDYDLIADKVAAALPQTDENALAEHIAAALPQMDENTIADRVAEIIPLTDYDLVAEHLILALAHDHEIKISEESIEKIAQRVAELLRGDEAELEQIARDTIEGNEEQQAEPQEEIAAAAEPEPAPEPEPEPAPVVVAPVATPEPPDGMMTRYKRSFIAKIIESDEEVKEYYSELKNSLLAYQKASSQVSWSNDRFTLKGETVAKIGIRGRTLCLYLALNPDEFPESVYHQKYAGDTKMYEKTPMMVKIKSGVALKRAVRLIELLMEKNGAVGDDSARVDYVAQYAYRSEQELLAEGLIKTAIVEKSDLDF